MQSLGWLAALGIGVAVVGLAAAGNRPGDAAGTAGNQDGIARGRVTSVTLSRLTVERDGRDWTFAVNADTDVLSGDTARPTRAWGSTPITAFVQSGDAVSVAYQEIDGAMIAARVRLAIVNP